MVLNVNGAMREVTVDPDVALLTVLRDYLNLTGSKYGCGEGACGAQEEMEGAEAALCHGSPRQVHEASEHSVKGRDHRRFRNLSRVASETRSRPQYFRGREGRCGAESARSVR